MIISIVMNVINVMGNAIRIFMFHTGAIGIALAERIERRIAALIINVLIFEISPYGD